MSDPLVTNHLGLPYLAAAQAQKHVTHNESLRTLDSLVQIAVADTTVTAPPSEPAEGDRYIVPGAATRAWAGHANDLADFVDGAWAFLTPRDGWVAFDVTGSVLLVFEDDSWRPVGNFVGALDRLGVNTTADDTNRLAVRTEAVLLTGIDAADGGSGDLRLVMNKEADGDTASLLFQSGFSGRGEIGLAGDTDLVFKVSDNGTDWVESIRIDPASGLPAILYDNGVSGLSAVTVQDAIDEIAGGSGGGGVLSVFGRSGAMAAAARDYDADQVDFTPAGGIAATDVQAAIEELDAEKAAASHAHAAGDITSGTFADARIAEGSVTQHEAALAITESQISDLDHTDADAFHDDVAGEIAALTEKGSPATADLLVIEDSADGNAKKKVQIGNLPGGGGGGDVSSVFGWTGAVVAAANDYDADQVDFTPAGGIAATDVQAAIEELDTEKLSLDGGTMTGDLVLAGPPDSELKAATKAYVDANGGFTSIVRNVVTPGTGTYTPSANLIGLLVLLTGAGAGGGGTDGQSASGLGVAGGGSGGDAAGKFYTAAELGANAAVSLGAGGPGGNTSGADGSNGGNSTFTPAGSGGPLTAGGGEGGDGDDYPDVQYLASGQGGRNRNASVNADYVIPGGDGVTGMLNGSASNGSGVIPRDGGRSMFATGGEGSINISGGTGSDGIRGSGGGGSTTVFSTTGNAAGDGGDGYCVIIELIAA